MSDSPTSVDIDSLVKQLSSEEPIERQRARFALVDIRAPAVPAVAKLADSPDDCTRWECAKTLAAIADKSAVDALVKLLDDSAPGICWDAAVGLAAIGKASVTPLLRAIIDRSDQFTILAGAHHALHELSRTDWGTCLRPVFDALDGPEPAVAAPVAALEALNNWEYRDTAR